MKKEIQLNIDYLSEDFRAIAEVNENTYIVDKALPDEAINALITDRYYNNYYGTVSSILTPSKDRIAPPCPYFEECGNCYLQFVDYKRQLKLKREALEAILEKNGFDEVKVNNTEALYFPYKYRNKIQLSFGHKGDKLFLGYKNPINKKIIPIEECRVCGEWVAKLINCTINYAKKFKLKSYSEETYNGELKGISAQMIDNYLRITLFTATQKLIGASWLYKELCNEFKNGVSLWINCEAINGNKSYLAEGNKKASVTIYSNELQIERLKLSPNDKLYGKLYKALAKDLASLYVVTINETEGLFPYILDSEGINSEEFYFDGLPFNPNKRPDAYVIESNGKLKEETIDLVSRIKVNSIYCVLNDTSSIDEIAINIASKGYNLISVTPYDMLPQTKKISAILKFKRK